MSADAITIEVIRNRLDILAEEMQAALIRTAHSSIVREASDASSAILDSGAQLVAQAKGVPVHLGSMDAAVASICRTFPVNDMQAGDVFIINDPYDGAQHLNDIVIAVPVIADGQTVAIAASMAHHQDIGGMSPGSMPQGATELYQEGLIIPALKLYDQGQPNHTLIAMVRKNVRIPDVVQGDIAAQLACVTTGRRRLEQLFTEYGTVTVLDAVAQLQDRAERMTRELIALMPDGNYEFVDYLDNDGVDLHERIRIKVAVTIGGSSFKADFSGSNRQVRGPFNSMPAVAMSAVRYVVRAVTDPDIPNNAGCYRPISVVVPFGSVLNPAHPAPVSSRGVTLRRMIDVVMGALVQAIPARVSAASNGHPLFCSFGGRHSQTGEPFVSSILSTGGQGARPTKDGVDAICTDASNSTNIPIEHMETYFPVRALRYALRADSGGAGQWRGGLGLECFVEITDGEVLMSHRGERHCTAPWGLFGGNAAAKSKTTVYRSDGRTEAVPSKQDIQLRVGDRIQFFTTGGGGYGDPLDRDPELVMRDVVTGKVSKQAAASDYGVVIGAGSMPTLDEPQTAALRRRLTGERGPIIWTYDRGIDTELE